MSSNDLLVVRGAREHNLVIDELSFEKGRLVVFTGVSGSGKSSLAFDTIYAEGQRRYVESLSTYARQFLGQLEKPKYEHIRGLCPTVAIEQKSASSNPRSTVGTVTEIYDYLRVLFARVGEQRCHQCGGPVSGTSAAQIVADLAAAPARSRVTLYGPVVEHRKGEFKDVLEGLRERGFARVRIDGETRSLDEIAPLDKKRKHSIDVVVDRLAIGKDDLARLTDSVETGLKVGSGRLIAELEGLPPRAYSEARACPKCNLSLPELTPQALSYNSPLGMCQDCHGLGTRVEVDPRSVVPDPTLTIDEGAVEPWRNVAESSGWTARIVHALCDKLEVPRDVPWKKIPAKKRELLLHGAGEKRIEVKWKGKHSTGAWAMKWEGLCPQLLRRFEATGSEAMREKYKRYLHEARCRSCDGMRLRPEARCVFLGGQRLVDVLSMTITQAHAYFSGLALDGVRAEIARELLKEIRHRLGFLLDVGLEYLRLDRATASLSGGEAQRIRLAAQLGSELSGVIYVLDEPSIGLHQRDNLRLIKTLEHLRDLGNTVIVVEHDADTILRADHVVDFGPGAGKLGGRVVSAGPPSAILSDPSSLTGRFLSGAEHIAVPPTRRPPRGHIEVEGARQNNLRDVDVAFPLGVFCAVTGVSGAGKSSLVGQILEPALRRALMRSSEPVGDHDAIAGIEQLDKVIVIDQQPIGRTPRSNPATYSKLFDLVRDVFAQTKEARAYGYGPGRFSFNVKGGRCEACEGAGVRAIEMHFLPDVFVRCETCKGRRYNDATLRVTFRGKSIAEVLESSVREGLSLFENVPAIARILETLDEVGLGYIALGQPATTLSGGEAQRVKLARELARRDTGRTLYILDEPTTGLHFADVRQLLGVLQRLVDAGNSVLVVEHNLDVVKVADFVIDLGPEGGDGGGAVVAQGTPEEVATNPGSHTGKYLADLLPGAGPTADLGGRAKRVRSAAPRGPRAGGARP
ncbi:MAG: excinuclease ABC subunit UvrA [Polyangiaceae bacterium]|nr:excinuclease ABC subunit UvrA [Polyangiaceae bacterium]